MTLTSGGILNTTKLGVITDHDLGAGIHIRTSDSSASVESDFDDLVIESSTHNGMTFLSGTGTQSNIAFGDSGDADIGRIAYDHNGDYMAFHANAAERMRIGSNGNVTIGSTATPQKLHVYGSHDTDNGLVKVRTSDASANDDLLIFYDGDNLECGTISLNGSSNSVAYNTSSDYRLKENETAITDGITRLKQLKPYRFNWKSEPSGDKVDGFFAHEVSSIVPEAILGDKDELRKYKEGQDIPLGKNVGDNVLDDSGNPIPRYQKIDQSKLVPLLTAAIIELEARVKTLEG